MLTDVSRKLVISRGTIDFIQTSICKRISNQMIKNNLDVFLSEWLMLHRNNDASMMIRPQWKVFQ